MGLGDKTSAESTPDTDDAELPGEMAPEEVDAWMRGEAVDATDDPTILLYGKDGTMKTGLVLQCINGLSDDGKIVVFDFDDSAGMLVDNYYDEQAERLLVRTPIVTVPGYSSDDVDVSEAARTDFPADADPGDIDIERTFERLHKGLDWIDEHADDENIEMVVFDGLGRLMALCEMYMRNKHDFDYEDGLNQRYWKIRTKTMRDLLYRARSMPMYTVFIGHDYFNIKDTSENEISNLAMDVNKMSHIKLHMQRDEPRDIQNSDAIDQTVEFTALFDKNKYDVLLEGQERTVMEVDQNDGDPELTLQTGDVVDELLQGHTTGDDDDGRQTE